MFNSGIFIGGGYTGAAQFGSFTLTGSSQNFPFVAKFDLNGNYTNAFSYAQAPTQTDAKCMSADGNGNYYVGGKLANSTVPIFSCTPASANRGFYLGSFTEQPDSVPTPSITVTDNLLTANPPFSGNIQWYLNGNMLSGENSQTLLAEESGSYSVEYTYLTGCTGSETSIFQTVTIASIDQNSKLSLINIYPNPINRNSTLNIEGLRSIKHIDILDMQGSLIRSFSTDDKESISISLSDVAAGVYFVKVGPKYTKLIRL